MNLLWIQATALCLAATSSYAHQHGIACNALSKALPGKVAFPNSTAYEVSNNYWCERQALVEPACFVTPTRTPDVAAAMKILAKHNQRFSVKGGGHATFAGASNVKDGVTIDLLHMKDITVSADRKTVSMGAGSRWGEVSEVLDPQGLAVVGGRVADVGVAGLVLGGGISFFSGRRGWACDNVRGYEVVLSSGKVVYASPTSQHRDLFWALRGGAGANFGIVTRFDLASFDQGNLWWRQIIYPGATNATLIPRFQDHVRTGLVEDVDAHTWFLMMHLPQLGGFIVLKDEFHAKTPAAPDAVPEVFAPFTPSPIEGLPLILNTTTVTSISNITRSLDTVTPYGGSHLWMNTATRLSATFLADVVPLWQSFVLDDLLPLFPSSPEAVTPYIDFHPLTTTTLAQMEQNGGNALGLSAKEGPMVIVQLQVSWPGDAETSSPSDEVLRRTKVLMSKIERLAKERRVNTKNGFVYMNYAEEKLQDVFQGYGRENMERLRRVARKYDQEGVLKRLWKGYFKV